MFTQYTRAGIAVLIFFISLITPLIVVNVAASPLNETTPTAIARTPITQNTPSARVTIEAIQSSKASSTAADKSYEVKPGDTLWSIAANVYGNGSMYVIIQQANGLPEKAVLRTGSKLFIPSTDPATPTLAPSSSETESIKPTVTPLPYNTATSTSLPMPSSQELISADVELKTRGTTNKSNGQESSLLIRYIQFPAYLLSIVCLMGSFYCAYLSFEVYQRNKLYVWRRRIGDRVRAGL